MLNSAGILSTAHAEEGSPPSVHIVVVLTEGARTQTEGVWTIEQIASAINQAIVPPGLVAPPARRTFAAAPLPAEGTQPPVDPTPAAVEPPTVPDDEPSPPIALVAFGQSDDVLVPADALLVGSSSDATELTLWYEVIAATADELLETYADSMLELGWFEVAGPPSIVLSKTGEGRWVGLSTYPASGGGRLVQVTISPAPSVLPAGFGAP